MKKISVIIATRNKLDDLSRCLLSISNSNFSDFEVIIMDQSDTCLQIRYLRTYLKTVSYKYIFANQTGKSLNLNIAINVASSPIIAFTDDDCIIHKNWLSEINNFFTLHSNVMGQFGRTLPYTKARQLHLHCPSTFDKKKSKFIYFPTKHWEDIGLGNNMAFRKEVLTSLNGFKTWLGPGTVAKAAEDGEIALHALSQGKTLYFNSKAIIYHNCWLTNKMLKQREYNYLIGETACYGYYSLNGWPFAQKVILERLMHILMRFRDFGISLIHGKKDAFSIFFSILLSTKFFLTGLCLGAKAFLKNKIIQNEKNVETY